MAIIRKAKKETTPVDILHLKITKAEVKSKSNSKKHFTKNIFKFYFSHLTALAHFTVFQDRETGEHKSGDD
jgi:hypothetical protein